VHNEEISRHGSSLAGRSDSLELIATTAFGLEKVAARELEQLGYSPRVISPGRLSYAGDVSAVARGNMFLRTAERVLILLAEFEAPDFDALFDTILTLPLEEWIPPHGAFPVQGKSIRSQLTSVPAIQRTVKKAAVQRLMRAHAVHELSESGPKYPLEIALLNNRALLTLDTTGTGLHKRGYRPEVGMAPLRETMAAALVMLSHWRSGTPLMDPFCGTGTILIEAALLGRQIAPGIRRSFLAEEWTGMNATIWREVRAEAEGKVLPHFETRLAGFDIDERSLRLARRNAEQAGVAEDIHFQRRPFSELQSSQQFGCLITNPPYGERLEDPALWELYKSFPLILRRLPTWSHFILTSIENFEGLVGQPAHRRRKLYNGRIECQYYQYLGPKPGKPKPRQSIEGDLSPVQTTPQVFGGLKPRAETQLGLFRARLTARARHLRRWPQRGISCYRLYDKDVPEIPLIVDRYEGHYVIYEVGGTLSRTPAEQADWLDQMIEVAKDVLQVDRCQIVLKKRRRQAPETQYVREGKSEDRKQVQEAGLKFWVNLTDFVDTGLYLDHRIARRLVRSLAHQRRVLNLFAYTGSFSVFAAAGGATKITTVDLSPNYLRWAQDNFRLNGIDPAKHEFIQGDAVEFVHALPRSELFDLVIADAPTFSNSKRSRTDWDVQTHHGLLLRSLESHLSKQAVTLFSVHFRRFKLDYSPPPPSQIWEISDRTVPEDFRDRRIHRCWWIGAQSPRFPA
jgi:23S rRNA (guanine2445-N2)-methyltransferase / 23S rRNA (guanine2069-N7)-methyltransferase